jgi:hypothetical protein
MPAHKNMTKPRDKPRRSTVPDDGPALAAHLQAALKRGTAARGRRYKAIADRLEVERSTHSAPISQERWLALPKRTKRNLRFRGEAGDGRLGGVAASKVSSAEKKQRIKDAITKLLNEHGRAKGWATEDIADHLRVNARQFFPGRIPYQPDISKATSSKFLRECRLALAVIRPRRKRSSA